MVVCTMQSYTREQQLKTGKSTRMQQNAEIINNGNGAEKEAGEALEDSEEDREEGEIVDEFEMIISSEDEEFKLRARIRQLEDQSKDIEKMEMLSANLSNQYNYQRPKGAERYSQQYPRFSPITVHSDVSSLSEEELHPPKKYRKHRMKRTESKKHRSMIRRNPFMNHMRIHPSPSHVRKKRRHEHHSNNRNHYQQQQLLDSLDSVTDDEICQYDTNVGYETDEYEERPKVSRNKLRVALGRTGNYDIKPKHSLRERLQYRMHKSPPSPGPASCGSLADHDYHQLKSEEQLPPHSFEGYSRRRSESEQEQDLKEQGREEQDQEEHLSVEEPAVLKLRLIALKSAILKKHLARKKRDAERAYSPTDMINRVHQPSITETMLNDIDDLMDISPATSPERPVYSPTPTSPARFAEPVDMELAQTDSEEDNRRQQQWSQNCRLDNSGGSWRCFMPNSLPPVSMPIVIDEEEEELLPHHRRKAENFVDVEDDEVPPPPPSFHIPHVHLEDDNARDASHLRERNAEHQPDSLSDIQSISMDNSQTQTSRPFQPESSDDEAAALRALLLSKRKPAAAVTAKKKPLLKAVNVVKAETMSHDSDDPEELRQLLLTSIASKKKNSQKAASRSPEILKKAVLRFQTPSVQSNHSLSMPVPTSAANLQPVPLPVIKPVSLPVPLPLVEPKSLPVPLPLVEPVSVPVPLPLVEPVLVPLPLPVLPAQVPAEAVVVPPKPTAAIPANIIKIVKPNKIINKKTAPKRKIPKLEESAPPVKRPATLLVKEPVAPLRGQNGGSSKSSVSTRLITALDPSTIKVNKLVITLAESSAGSDDDLELSSCYAYSSYTSYADNASPLSQVLDSASNSTTRSNTPNSEIQETAAPNLRRTVINEYFEKKLDDFLKQARSKVPTLQPLESSSKPTPEPEKSADTQLPKTTAEPSAVTPLKAKPTPVAVRHLPVASQKEYLRLIERMRLLEKKKTGVVKSTAAVPVKALSPNQKDSSAAANRQLVTVTGVPQVGGEDSASKATLAATEASDLPSSSMAAATQPSKESRLKAFENSFLKIGGSMITNLDKSLQMVKEAKKSKITRLRYAKRFKDLFAEMQAIRQAVKLEEAKLARIQPEIQASHEIIISLKQKRTKLRNAALDLGTGLKGADYRLLDPGKAEITSKSMLLTKEIRSYNTIAKYEDIPPDVPTCAAPVPEPEPEPEPKPDTEPEPESLPETETEVTQKSSSSNSDSQPPADEIRPETEPSNCDISEALTVDTQLDVDTTPKKVVPETLLSSGGSIPEIWNNPSYTITFMRELWQPPAKNSLLDDYRTPMSRNYNSQLNVNTTLCPFELMGRCEDTDCSYLHLSRALSAPA